ncbi:MAG: hypothetical protein ACLFNM_03165 [Candidatus Woesearchaeota archaeon]
MSKAKSLFSNVRIILLIAILLLSIAAISPAIFTKDGVAIRSISKDTAADDATPTIIPPQPDDKPRNREVIYSINNVPITSPEEYYNFTSGLDVNYTLRVKTSEGQYTLFTQPLIEETITNQTKEVTHVKTVFDEELNKTVNITVTEEEPVVIEEVVGVEPLGFQIYDAPQNNIKKGLDIAGGTRVIMEPEEPLTDDQLDFVLENIRQRLNVFGLSDIVVRSTSDFTGESYILVEIAGASKDEVSQLLSQQGKFEAYVGDDIVFNGGDDIAYVDKTAQGSGLDSKNPCQKIGDEEWSCGFRFAITLTQEAAQRQADVTADLDVEYAGNNDYLSENLTFVLDGEVVNELRIGSDLKGNPVTDISISGVGVGSSRDAAQQDALSEMKQMQTVLQTGSLPVELDIIQIDAISPTLGEEFIKNAVFVGLFAILAVVTVVTIRYRKPVISLPVIVCMVSEVVILLGFAAIVNWQLDLVAIAGIIIAVGTGVDDQIVIIDETLERGNKRRSSSWKKRLKNAFFIIMTAYFTTVVAMLPLLQSGAGLVKGFALTTIAGVTIGVFITRPAFAKILEILLGSSKQSKVDSQEDSEE